MDGLAEYQAINAWADLERCFSKREAEPQESISGLSLRNENSLLDLVNPQAVVVELYKSMGITGSLTFGQFFFPDASTRLPYYF